MKKLFQIILAVAIVGLIYVIYVQISTPIRFDDEMKAKKAQVIDRIKDIRTAQRAFKSKYQHFTASFDTLTAFVLSDTLEMERKIVDEDDSVAMAMLRRQAKERREIQGGRDRHHFRPQESNPSGNRKPPLYPRNGQSGPVHHGGRCHHHRVQGRDSGRGVPRPLQDVPRHGQLPSRRSST